MENKDVSGVLPLRKPKGMTSHDCVYAMRKLFHTKKVGHTGTLDPDVEGVLPICIGRATKIANYITANSKVYEGIISLGQATDTEDASGEVIKTKELGDSMSRSRIIEVFATYTGDIVQIPPMYSAVKVKGKRLYEYARAGLEVERPKRHVTIYNLELLSDAAQFQDKIPFRVHCSKGTYVRTLAVDIGETLGYPAHLSYLIRTASGSFKLDDCYSLEDLQRLEGQGELSSTLISMGDALSELQKLVVDDELAEKVLNGGVFSNPTPFYTDEFTVYNKQGECLAIYQPHPTKSGMVKPVRVLKNY